MKTLISLETRFFGLVAVILCVAVLGTTFAVSQSAKPFLVSLQREAINQNASKRAEKLDRMLAADLQFLEYIGSFPDVVALTVGNITNPLVVSDYLSQREYPNSVLRVELFDVLEDQLLDFRPRGVAGQAFTDNEFAETAEAVLNAPGAGDASLRILTSDLQTHVMVSAPVRYNGHVEGVLVAELAYPTATFSPASALVSASFVVHEPHSSEAGDATLGAVSAPVGDTGLSVVVVPDAGAAIEVGRDMIETVVIAVGLVLLLPFGLFALIGRNALLRPHVALRRSERLLQEQKTELSELAAVAENANDAIIVTDLGSRIRWVNPSFERLSERSASEVIGRVPGSFLQGAETDLNAKHRISKALKKREPIACDLLNYTKTGKPYWISLSISPLFRDDGEAYAFMAISRDITEQRAQRDALVAAKSEIEVQALLDPLTEMPNRRALDTALADRLRETSGNLTVIRIDLDHFKYVNDTLGHDAGDFALCEVARLIGEETRASDVAARIGGDEFVILLAPGSTTEIGIRISERLRALIRKPMSFKGKVLQLGASFGVASNDGDIIDRGEVSVSADAALYLAKDRGRNRIEVYAPALHSDVVEKRSLATEIRNGIRNREFVPFFQPQVDAKTFEITGAETLARWISPTRGVVSPGVFLPIAEQLSVVEDIDAIVFEEALSILAKLSDDGIGIPKVSFNVTAQRLTDQSILDIMQRLAPPGMKIAFEILESVLLEEKMSDFDLQMDLMREAGIEIEIDDFGSGHASIIGLLRSAPDTMKIDQRLIAPLTNSDSYQQMVRSIVQIGKSQDINVIAEGVETHAHATILRDLGVDFLQGYYFAKPMPAAELMNFLSNYRGTGPSGQNREAV